MLKIYSKKTAGNREHPSILGAGKLFGTDGIRERTGKFPLTKSALFALGEVSGKVLRKNSRSVSSKILFARDTRQSGEWIEKALSLGLKRSGCKSLSCGVLPTSAVSVLLKTQKKFLAGVVISASHNPAEFNGIKFFSSDGNKIPDEWEEEIETIFRKIVHRPSRLPAVAQGRVGYRKFNSYPNASLHYLQFLKSTLAADFSLKGVRWVLDCANGAASKIAPKIFQSLGAIIKLIHAKPNGKNINLQCGALYPQSLQSTVTKFKAAGGCAFDGDADRVQFVDEKGRLMDGDILLDLLASFLKKKKQLQNNTVVTTLMANFGFYKRMEQKGIQVITTAVGDRAVSDAMKKYKASLGGEQSGHIIFSKFLPTGDGILTALQVLCALKENDKKLSSYTDTFPKYPQILLNVRVKEKIPIEKVPELKDAISSAEREMDRRGKIVVRYSGTEPLLRIMVQGETQFEIKKVAETLARIAQNSLS